MKKYQTFLSINCSSALYLVLFDKRPSKEIVMRLLAFILTCALYQISFAMAPKVNLNVAIERAIQKYGIPAEPKLKNYFQHAGVAYPPKKIALLAFKKERKLELWARHQNRWKLIHIYPLTAFSGRLGPKLKENDRQIPEGIYHLVNFNPFSAYHLSMMIDYPNEFDKMHAEKEGRRRLGNNIFLHGKNTSIGCLAVGNAAIDELFVLIRKVGLKQTKLIIAPNDLRHAKPATPGYLKHKWLPSLYKNIKMALNPFPAPKIIAKS